MTGMRSERGYTLFELLIVLGLIGIVTAISVPVFMESNRRNNVWNGSEQVGAAIRQARLKAVSQNTSYRVVFDCPSADELRVLIVTGEAGVDNDDGRCDVTLEGDTGTIVLPTGVSYDPDGAEYLQVSGRGFFTATGGTVPLTISVTNGSATRTLEVSLTGQIAFADE